MVNGQSIDASPVFNKKRSKRSLSRRVSFAEKPAVRIFVKDIEYETPPDAKTQRAGFFSSSSPIQAEANVAGTTASVAHSQDTAAELGRTAEGKGSALHSEVLPAGNTGPVSFNQSARAAVGGGSEQVTVGEGMEELGAQQSTPEVQQQAAAGRHHGTPAGTPGGNESSPEFFSPRNYVSPLSR